MESRAVGLCFLLESPGELKKKIPDMQVVANTDYIRVIF